MAVRRSEEELLADLIEIGEFDSAGKVLPSAAAPTEKGYNVILKFWTE
jgi:hypothetical protein